MFKNKLVALSGLVVIGASMGAAAHSVQKENALRNAVSVSTSLTYRSSAAVEKNEPGLIPGAMQGGEALPVEEGLVVDDAQIVGTWVSPAEFFVRSSLMSHQYAGEAELEFESLWVGARSTPLALDLAVGKMFTRVSPTAAWHASQSLFSEAPLLADVFWGRHFTDTGIRVAKDMGAFALGLEAWNGDSWPASTGEGSMDAYLHYNQTWHSLALSAGLWGGSARADGRSDTRYSVGHSHGGQNIVNPAGDYQFTGDIEMAGVFAKATFPVGPIEFSSELEVADQSSSGQLSLLNQQSALEADYRAVRVKCSAAYQKHTWALSFERLTLENRFYGSISELFVETAGLLNNTLEPTKTSLVWHYQWRPELGVRSEWVDDKSASEQGDRRFNLGIHWAHTWY